MKPTDLAADLVAGAMMNQPIEARGAVLRALLFSVVGGLVTVEGEELAAEECYRVGDACVRRKAVQK
jgi:hypothetical protein